MVLILNVQCISPCHYTHTHTQKIIIKLNASLAPPLMPSYYCWHSVSPSLKSLIIGDVPATTGCLIVSFVSQITGETVSMTLPILSYLPPYQDKNPEYHRGDYWAWRSQNYFRILYDMAVFAFGSTLWFVFPPPTHWRLVLGLLGEKWSPKPSWDPTKTNPLEIWRYQMGVEKSAAVPQIWGLREGSGWIRGLKKRWEAELGTSYLSKGYIPALWQV